MTLFTLLWGTALLPLLVGATAGWLLGDGYRAWVDWEAQQWKRKET